MASFYLTLVRICAVKIHYAELKKKSPTNRKIEKKYTINHIYEMEVPKKATYNICRCADLVYQ